MRRAARTRHLPLVAGVSAVALFAASPAIAGADRVRAEGRLVVYSRVLPTDATARVEAVYDSAGHTSVALEVRGLEPVTSYAARAHVHPCGRSGGAAGPLFQNVVDPVSPSDDPVYANPVNEIWLDLTTDAAGNGTAQTSVPWQFSPGRRARSVVLHERHAPSVPGSAATAGARLACLDVRF